MIQIKSRFTGKVLFEPKSRRSKTPLLEAIVAEADALDENDVAPVADYLDVSGYVSTTIGQLRAVVEAWKARRQC